MFRFGSALDQLDHDQECCFIYSAFEEVTDLVSLIKGVSQFLLLALTQSSSTWQIVHWLQIKFKLQYNTLQNQLQRLDFNKRMRIGELSKVRLFTMIGKQNMFHLKLFGKHYKSNNFTVKMSAKKGYLFCMDLRIYNQIIKLKVYEEDNVTDVINRLAVSIKDKQISKQKLKGKLEDQFREVIKKTDLSQTVKSKLDSLLDESKIIIVGIDTDKNQRSFNETPFRILQQSTINGKKPSQEKLQKSVQQLNRDTSHLNLKQDSNQYVVQNARNVDHSNNNYYNLITRTKNSSPSKFDNQIARSKEQSLTEIFQKRYQALDRKCQNYISKNIPNAERLDFKRQAQYYQQNVRKDQNYQRRGGYKQLIVQNDMKLLQAGKQNHYLRTLNGNEININVQGFTQNETFQQYKLNRYKATSTHKMPRYEQTYQPKYQSRDNRQNQVPPKSITRIKYPIDNCGYSITYGDSNSSTIRSYDTMMNAKLLGGNNVSCKGLKTKFNYLGE